MITKPITSHKLDKSGKLKPVSKGKSVSAKIAERKSKKQRAVSPAKAGRTT